MRAIFFSFICVAFASASEIRIWTDDQDRTVEAALTAIKDDAVTFRMQDGSEVDFPIAKLSSVDVEYIDKHREAFKKKAALDAMNFDAPWPDRVTFRDDPEIELVEDDADKNRFVYESANFRYVCDVKLANSVVMGFSRMFESTHRYCMTLPLGFGGGESAKKIDEKYLILLFEKQADYIKAGGPPGSAGVFIGGKGIIMVPLSSLGVRLVGTTYVIDSDKTNKTLPHEITHQLTPNVYYAPGSMGWFTEGIAEYVGVTPYTTLGTYKVKSNLRAIREYVTAYGRKDKGGRALGDKIQVPSLKRYFLQDYGSFVANAQVNYGVAALLTYYFAHMDGDGDAARLRAFLAALHQGKKGEAALEVLLDGRSYDELEAEIVEKWGAKQVDFTFGG